MAELRDADPAEDLRDAGRVHTVYLPCCLRAGQHCKVGLIRNISKAGMMVETEIEAEPGSELAYFQETTQWRRARVIWRDGRRVGLQDIDEETEQTPLFPHRAIRIPTSLLGRIWLGGRAIEVGIGNMSNKGVLAFGVPSVDHGQLLTLTIAGREFANTSLRWWHDGSAGLQFERPLNLRTLNEFIEVAERGGSSPYFERRINELLEVIPANDARKRN
jgi:hypothetical protein